MKFKSAVIIIAIAVVALLASTVPASSPVASEAQAATPTCKQLYSKQRALNNLSSKLVKKRNQYPMYSPAWKRIENKRGKVLVKYTRITKALDRCP